MKKLTTGFMLSLIVSGALSANDTNTTAIKQEGVKYIKMLGKALKSEVQAKMKEDPTGTLAMGFCSTKAMDITEEINNKLPDYASVRRIAIKIRNEKNSPDATDEKVLKAYEAAIATKTFDPNDIKIVKDTNNTYRIYKPLLTGDVCLKCHGQKISDDIQAILKKSYPHDNAVNFKKGDLRGAIVSELKQN